MNSRNSRNWNLWFLLLSLLLSLFIYFHSLVFGLHSILWYGPTLPYNRYLDNVIWQMQLPIRPVVPVVLYTSYICREHTQINIYKIFGKLLDLSKNIDDVGLWTSVTYTQWRSTKCPFQKVKCSMVSLSGPKAYMICELYDSNAFLHLIPA